jgi:sugar phosphate isomerase/epimerase
MQLLGHTLGTPHLSVEEALALFARVGLDGAEVIWQDDYKSAIPERDDGAARRALAAAQGLGLEIHCLTPYMTDINSLDPVARRRDIDRFRRCIETAGKLGTTVIRVYAGSYQPERDADRRADRWSLLVDALVELSGEALAHGVVLCVENHFGTMAVSARETRDLMEAVGEPAVGVLYDQANLSFTHREEYPEAIRIQAPWIRHVHAKDFVFTDPRRSFLATAVHQVRADERSVASRVVGEGLMDWRGILKRLRGIGYQGAISLEYEARWHPQDLPRPEEGLRRSVTTLRAMLGSLDD